MGWVMDCSIAAALALPDERSELAVRFLTDTRDAGEIWIPPLCWYEFANALITAAHRKRIAATKVEEALAAFSDTGIRQDTSDIYLTVRAGQALALEHRLTAYDAAYLELALRKRLGLATLDKALKAAAGKVGVGLFE